MAAITHTWHDLVHDMRDEMHDLTMISKVDAARQAYLALWVTFMGLPLLFGLDKFIGLMNGSWEIYLSSWANAVIPGTAATAMLWIGAVEVLLAVLVLAMPRIGGDLLALWLVIAAINMFSVAAYTELGLACLAAAACVLAMARMSTAYHHKEG